MRARQPVPPETFLSIKEQTLEDCTEIIVRACQMVGPGRQQASLTCFVGLAIAASALECAPSPEEASLFAAHMHDHLAQLLKVYSRKVELADHDCE